jgi:hypothetical protein
LHLRAFVGKHLAGRGLPVRTRATPENLPMNSTSVMYNMVLVPLVCFGGFSVMLCFVLLLPGVGQGLAALWVAVFGDIVYNKVKERKAAAASEKSGPS